MAAGGSPARCCRGGSAPRPEPPQPLERLDRHRAQESIAADDDHIRVDSLELDEDGLERGKAPVDVGERRDAHAQRVKSATVSTCGVCGNMSTGRARPSR